MLVSFSLEEGGVEESGEILNILLQPHTRDGDSLGTRGGRSLCVLKSCKSWWKKALWRQVCVGNHLETILNESVIIPSVYQTRWRYCNCCCAATSQCCILWNEVYIMNLSHTLSNTFLIFSVYKHNAIAGFRSLFLFCIMLYICFTCKVHMTSCTTASQDKSIYSCFELTVGWVESSCRTGSYKQHCTWGKLR